MTANDPGDDDIAGELRALPRDIEPPASLETRVTHRLSADGLLTAKSRPAPWRSLAVAAALALAFLGGWQAGRDRTPAAPASGSRYLLLLYPGASSGGGEDDVEVYRKWAEELRAQGRYVTGERLTPGSVSPDHEPAGDALEGYFVIGADGDRDAAALARTHPHARNGGRVVVRRIDPT
jgi:hypothetical protein